MFSVLFLDIDGVLNSHHFLYTLPRRADYSERRGNEWMEIDPTAVARLNTILARTGAKIVVSSSWRHGRTVEWLQETLVKAGFVGEVIDVTADYITGRRGDEIQDWLYEHPEVTHSVAVDDDADDSDYMKANLVKTSFKTGLLDEHVERVVERLR